VTDIFWLRFFFKYLNLAELFSLKFYLFGYEIFWLIYVKAFEMVAITLFGHDWPVFLNLFIEFTFSG
jgi:hypothetical protein